MADTVRTRHKVSGVIEEHTPLHIVTHSVLGEHLEVVGPEAKPFVPEMHKAPKEPKTEIVALREPPVEPLTKKDEANGS